MKTPLLLLLSLLLLFSSCKKDQDTVIPEEPKPLFTAPPGFEIRELTTPQVPFGINKIHFLDQQNGFLMANTDPNSITHIFKTEDGGVSWSETENPILFEFTTDFLFFNKQEGLAIGNGPMRIHRTENGGRTWKRHSFPQLGVFYGRNLQMDEKGNLFTVSDINQDRFILRSQDQGLSWETILYLEPDNTGSFFDFQVAGEHIYAVEFGALSQFDINGNWIKMILDIDDIHRVEVIDENHIIVSKYQEVIKTDDGGVNWAQIYGEGGEMIGFSSSEEGLMFHESLSPDTQMNSDVLAYTEDGGDSWVKGDPLPDIYTFDHQKIAENHYMLLINNTLYELKKL